VAKDVLHSGPLFLTDEILRKNALFAFDLIAKGWWSRIWAVQEVVLARQVTLVYGGLAAPLHTTVCCHTHRLIIHDTTDPTARQNASDRPASIVGSSEKLMETVEAGSLWQKKRTSLLTLLQLFRYGDSTEPRGQVFALLNLVTKWGMCQPIHRSHVQAIQECRPFLHRRDCIAFNLVKPTQKQRLGASSETSSD